jgi:hypothetical protein
MLEREAKKAKPCRHPDGAQQAEHLKPSDCMKLESHSKSRSAALSTVGASLILPSALLVIMRWCPLLGPEIFRLLLSFQGSVTRALKCNRGDRSRIMIESLILADL